MAALQSPSSDPSRLFSAKGIIALITGGGSGIGFMMTKALAEAGADRIYIVGRRFEVLEKAAKVVGTNDIPLAGDVTSRDSLRALVKAVDESAGYLNLLVCKSGIGGPQVPKIEPGVTTLDTFRDQNLALDFDEYLNTFKVNAVAVWYMTMAFLQLLDKGNKKGNISQSSQVVTVSSIAGFNKAAPGGYAYGQSKAAAALLAKQLSVVLPQWNIRSNCIAPGLFPSEMSAPIVEKLQASTSIGGPAGSLPTNMVPVGRMGNSADMAGTILYLASKAGAYCNGSVMLIDGGRLGMQPSTY